MILIYSLVTRFLYAFLVVVVSLSGLLTVFDLLANADSVLEHHAGELLPLLHYVSLRIQQIFSFVLPLAVLIAAMVLFVRMVLTQEIVILRATGISVHYILGILALATVMIAFVHLSFLNLILPHTSATLYRWQKEDYRGVPMSNTSKIASDWVASGHQFIRAESVSEEGFRLRNIQLVTRDDNYAITDYLAADSAIYQQGMWRLDGVRELHSDNEAPQGQNVSTLRSLPFEPRMLSLTGVREEELSYGDLLLLMDKTDEDTDNSRPYAFWFHHKLAYPFSSFVMLMMAVPVAFQLARRNQILICCFGCIMAGFLFYVVQQLLASLGETAALPPILAAWSPAILGASMTNWAVLHWET
ncbi:MAG: LptF/LptG family permease [Rickettsiales bacterium]|nr:LptF/LptG family permease [Rickettsiales bacterium]